MSTPAFMTGSWKTTVMGVVAGMLAYLSQLGPHFPTNTEEWGKALAAAFIAALGLAAKDGNKTHAPVPTPTTQTMAMHLPSFQKPEGK